MDLVFPILFTQRHSPLQFSISPPWQPEFDSSRKADSPEMLPTFLPPPFHFSAVPRLAPSHRFRAPLCCATPPSPPPPSPDEEAIVTATARTTHHLSINDVSSLSTFELLAFCSVKGLNYRANIWDRQALLATANEYVRKERMARVKSGDEWDVLTDKEKIRLLHDVCNGEGDVTYMDPSSGYTVFSAFAHLKRGDCCGIKEGEGGAVERTHRCRHCPYGNKGDLAGGKMSVLKERVWIVEESRKRAMDIWQGGRDGIGGNKRFGDVEQDVRVAVGDLENKDEWRRKEDVLAKKFAKVVRRDKGIAKEGDFECEGCADEQFVTCTRCSGWTFLVSPKHMDCPQCSAKGYHPCMSCTPFRPPSRSSFYS